jgi:Leucine-rich repeat (LRR) protein
LPNLKSLNCKENKLPTLAPVSKLSNLQTLLAGNNVLGKPCVETPLPDAVPPLPSALKQLALDNNFFSSIPLTVLSPSLSKLEKLDLSYNQLAALPAEISHLVKLEELKLDHNMIVALPEAVGMLSKLKTLSLKDNAISVSSTIFSGTNPQPLPASLFTDTPLIDLNLHGNRMTSTQLNQFDGFPAFLSRREKVKTKDLYGGAMTNFDVCGLE